MKNAFNAAFAGIFFRYVFVQNFPKNANYEANNHNHF